jgi:hypothetical protein
MARRVFSLGFFGLLGRSPELRAFDRALYDVDLHPKLVPEAVKLTAVRMLADQADQDEPEPQSYRQAAEIIAYCMIGAEAFAGANDQALARDVERRIEAALETGASLDAKMVLLALHARIIQPSVIDHFELESVGS